MTQQEFLSFDWRKSIDVKYCGERYRVVSVNFFERLIALDDVDMTDPVWVRCESVELVK